MVMTTKVESVRFIPRQGEADPNLAPIEMWVVLAASGREMKVNEGIGFDMSEAVIDTTGLGQEIPVVPNIDAEILSRITPGKDADGDDEYVGLDMSDWHTCETEHCRAGWAVHLAGDAGYRLEEQLGVGPAAALIYTASGSHPVPDWLTNNYYAYEDIKERAERLRS